MLDHNKMFMVLQLWLKWLSLQHLQNLGSGLVISVWFQKNLCSPIWHLNSAFHLDTVRWVWNCVHGGRMMRWKGGKFLFCLQFFVPSTGRKGDSLMEDWYPGTPEGLPGILQVDANYLNLWEKGQITCLLFVLFCFVFLSWLGLEHSDYFYEQKLRFCVSCASDQKKNSLEDCYAPRWHAGHWWVGGGNYGEILAEWETWRVTHPPLEVWDTCVPVCASVGVELFIQPGKQKLRFWVGFFCLFSKREILFEIYFV